MLWRRMLYEHMEVTYHWTAVGLARAHTLFLFAWPLRSTEAVRPPHVCTDRYFTAAGMLAGLSSREGRANYCT